MRLLACGVCALIAGGLGGCSTAGYTKGNAAAHSLERAAAEVQVQSQNLEKTMRSLKALVNEPETDLRKPFRRFSRDLERFAASVQRVNATGREMEQRHAAYLQTWNQQIDVMDYQRLRDVSQARWLEVSNRFDRLDQRYLQNQEVVGPVISYLNDIRLALSTDLTSGGLQAIRGTVENADANAAKVQAALSALTRELLQNQTELSTVAHSRTNMLAKTNKLAKE